MWGKSPQPYSHIINYTKIRAEAPELPEDLVTLPFSTHSYHPILTRVLRGDNGKLLAHINNDLANEPDWEQSPYCLPAPEDYIPSPLDVKDWQVLVRLTGRDFGLVHKLVLSGLITIDSPIYVAPQLEGIDWETSYFQIKVLNMRIEETEIRKLLSKQNPH